MKRGAGHQPKPGPEPKPPTRGSGVKRAPVQATVSVGGMVFDLAEAIEVLRARRARAARKAMRS